MGQSSSAYLFYGYAEEEEGDWADLFAERKGLHDDDDCDNEEFYDDLCGMDGKNGMEVSTYGHYDYSCWFVGLGAQTAYGYSKEGINPKSLKIGKDWDAKLEKFFKKMGITPPGKPQWVLCSSLG